VSAFDDADASLASGAPFLAAAEPALLLLAFARSALGGVIGDADALDTTLFRRRLILSRIEGGIGGDQVRRAPELCLVKLDRRDQEVAFARPPIGI
jgi:hypothetical protein